MNVFMFALQELTPAVTSVFPSSVGGWVAMMAFLVHLQSGGASIQFAPAWELTKGIMLTLSTAGILWTSRTVFFLRDDVRDLKKDVGGADGKNGVKSDVRTLGRRVDEIERRNDRQDVADEFDREGYQGEDRRVRARRLRDQLKELDDKGRP